MVPEPGEPDVDDVALADVYPPEEPAKKPPIDGAKPADKDAAKDKPPEGQPKKQAEIPMDKPFKVDGAQIQSIIILPKGFTGKYPVAQAANEEMLKQQEEIAGLKATNEEMSLKLSELEVKNTELQKSIEDRSTQDRTILAADIVETKLGMGVLEVDPDSQKALAQKAAAVKELSKLPVDQLKILRKDVRALSKATKTAAGDAMIFTPGVEQHRDLSNSVTRKAELRQKMFGHAQPLGEKE